MCTGGGGSAHCLQSPLAELGQRAKPNGRCKYSALAALPFSWCVSCPSQRSTPRVTSGREISEQPMTSGTGKRADLCWWSINWSALVASGVGQRRTAPFQRIYDPVRGWAKWTGAIKFYGKIGPGTVPSSACAAAAGALGGRMMSGGIPPKRGAASGDSRIRPTRRRSASPGWGRP